jgi:hypothetical protein
VELLRSATGIADLTPEILSVMRFEMGGQVADTFRRGRAFLVGDAAHRTTPVGGTGMNTAIHGAHNLGWKMAWVLRGWAGESLLDSYELERRPIGTQNVLRSLRPGPGPEGNGLAGDIGVRYDAAVLVSATPTGGRNADSAGDVGVSARVGERAPHCWIERVQADRIDPGVCLSTLDLFEGRLTLLIGRRGHAWAVAAAELGTNPPGGTSLDVVIVGRDVRDLDGGLERQYQLGDAGAVLVRPDGYVAWRSDQHAGAAAELAAALETTLALPADRGVGRRRAG